MRRVTLLAVFMLVSAMLAAVQFWCAASGSVITSAYTSGSCDGGSE